MKPNVDQTETPPDPILPEPETQAIEGFGLSELHFAGFNQTMTQLEPHHQKEVGKTMFYAIASLTGEFHTESTEKEKRSMLPGEIRETVAKWPESDRAGLEKRIAEFQEQDPESAKIGMTAGAAEWGGNRWDALQAEQAAGKEVEQQDLNNAASLYLNGMGYQEQRRRYTDAVNTLLRSDRIELAQQVVDATINA